MKYVEVESIGFPRCEWNCPAVRLLQKYIDERPQDIEYMKVEQMPKRMHKIFPVSSQFRFQNLRVFKSEWEHVRLYAQVTRQLLTGGAPNLEAYDVELGKTELKAGKFPEDKFRILKNVRFEPGCSMAPLEQYEKLVAARPQLITLYAQTPQFKRSPMLFRGWKCLRQLFESSVNSLTTVKMHALVALMLEDGPGQVLLNVRDLVIEVPRHENGANLRKAMKGFNFKALFPAPTTAKVGPQRNYNGEFNDNFYNKFRAGSREGNVGIVHGELEGTLRED